MSGILEWIIAYKRDEIATTRSRMSEAAVLAAATDAMPTRGFAAALAARCKAASVLSRKSNAQVLQGASSGTIFSRTRSPNPTSVVALPASRY